MRSKPARRHAAAVALPLPAAADPALGAAVTLVGCFLTFYLIGLVLIPLGVWLWRRSFS